MASVAPDSTRFHMRQQALSVGAVGGHPVAEGRQALAIELHGAKVVAVVAVVDAAVAVAVAVLVVVRTSL